eukprot:6182557-Pleurochrysis_carterae.AAC.3
MINRSTSVAIAALREEGARHTCSPAEARPNCLPSKQMLEVEPHCEACSTVAMQTWRGSRKPRFPVRDAPSVCLYRLRLSWGDMSASLLAGRRKRSHSPRSTRALHPVRQTMHRRIWVCSTTCLALMINCEADTCVRS